ncbi:MAG TPA: secretin N-terminal domain-containing protein, partial [Candidatus Sumerlaeota bacterium]|nr:secretin N-terminal domain-containing protein [Candidatus Sumerlaeota bacterium]
MIRKTSYWILGVAFALLLAQAAGADWNITDVRVTADGSRETIHVLFARAPEQSAVPSFTDQAFREAGYGCLEIRDASASGGDRAIAHDGSFVKSVRILNDKDTCRVLFHLNRWSPYAIEQDGEEIRVIFGGESRRGGMADAPALFAMNSGPGQATLVLTNDPLDAFMSGAEKGEAVVLAQTTDKPLTISSKEPPSFYTPPSADQRATVAARAEEDIFARLVTLRFKDADLQNIIRLIAQQTGLNVIMAKSQVSGTITVNLEDVPLGSALDAILKTHGLAFVREPGGIVRIVPRSEIQAAKIETKTVHIPVNWVPATTLANTLRPFLSTAEGAQIQADSESNALIIIDTPPNVETLIALAEKLDVPEKQVMIEMRLVDIGKNLLRDIGTNWSLNQQQKYRTTTSGGEPLTKTTVIAG